MWPALEELSTRYRFEFWSVEDIFAAEANWWAQYDLLWAVDTWCGPAGTSVRSVDAPDTPRSGTARALKRALLMMGPGPAGGNATFPTGEPYTHDLAYYTSETDLAALKAAGIRSYQHAAGAQVPESPAGGLVDVNLADRVVGQTVLFGVTNDLPPLLATLTNTGPRSIPSCSSEGMACESQPLTQHVGAVVVVGEPTPRASPFHDVFLE